MTDRSDSVGIESLLSSTWTRQDADLGQRLSAFLLRLLALEYLRVGAAAYVATVVYHFVILNQAPSAQKYVVASIGIATLELLVSSTLRHYAEIQIQPIHRFLWNGIGAVLLALSMFVAIIFLLKIGADYSRGTYLFQFVSVGAAVLSVRALGFSKMHSAISSGHMEARRVAMIGHSPYVRQFVSRLRSAGIQTVSSFDYPGCEDESLLQQHSDTGGAVSQGVEDIIGRCR